MLERVSLPHKDEGFTNFNINSLVEEKDKPSKPPLAYCSKSACVTSKKSFFYKVCNC